MLQLSDFHFSWAVPLALLDEAVTRGLAEEPDLICLTGDFVTGVVDDLHSGEYGRILSRLTRAAPTYAVFGNHDGGLWSRAQPGGGYGDTGEVRRLLEGCGVRVLHNDSVEVQVAGARQALTLAGVGDLWSDGVEGALAFSRVDHAMPVVLLAHNPDSKDLVQDHVWDLMLSGHTHGGQVVLPLVGAAFAPVVDKRYVGGLGSWGSSRQIHVSRGVGNLWGVRFGCRPEVNLVVVG